MNSYVCQCVPGFIETHCEVNVDECASDPCRGNQECVDRVGVFNFDIVIIL